MPKLQSDFAKFNQQLDRLDGLVDSIVSLSPKYQKLLAEIVLLRLHYIFENAVSGATTKLLCQAPYLDGTLAQTQITILNRPAAIRAMETYGRRRAHKLRWSKVQFIRENTRYVMLPDEHLISTLDQHGVFVDELRRVRNRIAHDNRKARSDFQDVVRRYYGAKLNAITPGVLLLTPRRVPPLLRQYLAMCRALVRVMLRG